MHILKHKAEVIHKTQILIFLKMSNAPLLPHVYGSGQRGKEVIYTYFDINRVEQIGYQRMLFLSFVGGVLDIQNFFKAMYYISCFTGTYMILKHSVGLYRKLSLTKKTTQLKSSSFKVLTGDKLNPDWVS